MNVNVTGAFVYFTIPILGGIPVTQTMVSSFIVTAILLIAFVKLGKNLQKKKFQEFLKLLLETNQKKVDAILTKA